jgi:hypothetical protein
MAAKAGIQLAVALAVAAALALAAAKSGCRAEVEDPFEALAAGDHGGARRAFERELAAEPERGERWLKLKLGHVQALAHVDPSRAASQARDLLASQPELLGERGVVRLADALLDGERFDEARQLLEATVAAWPESRLLDAKHSDVVGRMRASGKPEDLRKLDSLGYGGGGAGSWTPRPGATPPRDGASERTTDPPRGP